MTVTYHCAAWVSALRELDDFLGRDDHNVQRVPLCAIPWDMTSGRHAPASPRPAIVREPRPDGGYIATVTGHGLAFRVHVDPARQQPRIEYPTAPVTDM